MLGKLRLFGNVRPSGLTDVTFFVDLFSYCSEKCLRNELVPF